MRGPAPVFAPVLFEQAFEVHVDVALVGNQAHGAVGQAVRAARILHAFAEIELEECDQSADAIIGRWVLGHGLGFLRFALDPV